MSEQTQDMGTLSFEEALAALQETVAQLEAGDQDLASALTLYEKGQALVRLCQEQLEAATLRIEQLTEDGEIITK